MGIVKWGVRVTIYGGLALALPIAYNLGYQRGAFEAKLESQVPSHLERIAEHQFAVTNPDDYTKYTIDFEHKTVHLYRSQQLEAIFDE